MWCVITFLFKAPGYYEPEKGFPSILGSSPRYTFGVKHKDPKPDETPGMSLEYICYLVVS